MTRHEPAGILSRMYQTVSRVQRTAMIHLLGIHFASKIINSGFTPNEILTAAKISGAYVAEINKGMSPSKTA